jgi:cardiolipin synthase
MLLFLLLDNRRPEKTIAWALVLIMLPVAGLIAYMVMGRNLRKEKLLDRKSLMDDERVIRLRTQQLNHLLKNELEFSDAVQDKKNIITFLLKSSKAILSEFNSINHFTKGSDAFESIFNDLERARHHIHLEYYIFEPDSTGSSVKNILIQKARQGVEVRFIYDSVGSWGLTRKFLNEMKDAGVETREFLPVQFPWFTSRVNYRNHRKIIVIDGTVGYVGGMNVADRYIDGTPKLGAWRDSHLRLEGGSVKALQLVFCVDWDFVNGSAMANVENYFPPTIIKSRKFVQIAASGPDSETSYMMETFFATMVTARKNIYITTPYFLPNESILTALRTAAFAGVEIKIIIPRKSDSYMVSFASLSYIQSLLKLGIRVFFYRKGFIHAKTMTVDSIISSVGTANMDYRSFDYNLEVNAIIYDEEFAREMEDQFNRDLEFSEEIFLDRWRKRKLTDKIRQSAARLFAPIF